MAIKQTAHIIRGLRRDFSDSKQPKEYAIDAKNIRITNREDSSLLSITNEKGTQKIALDSSILGKYLGHTVINEFLVLFTRDETQESSTDYIYKIDINRKKLHTLFRGDLGFEGVTNIEALGVYESEDIQKIYWVDGINQPRVINIAAKQEEIDSWTNKSFDFIQELQLNETIKVEKSYSSGSFNSGVIQYAFNYYNKNGQESNIVEVTPINYISYEDRGAAPNDYVSNSFKITINNIDKNFDYIRLYSIHRTALDAQPSIKLITDLKADKNTIEYIDTGIIGETIDPVELLYKGGEYIIPKTLAQKDGTLFFGNIKLKNIKQLKEDVPPDNVFNESKYPVHYWRTQSYYKIGNLLQGSEDIPMFSWEASKEIGKIDSLTGYYPYKAYLNKGDNTTFKSEETYRLGIQFQENTGKWSEPIFYNDDPVNKTPIFSDNKYLGIKGKLYITNKIVEWAISNNYKKVRPVVVYPSESEREVVAQGILCPTVFNASSRYNGTLEVQSSWFFRPNIDDIDNCNILASNKDNVKYGSYSEFRHGYALPDITKRNSEIQNMFYYKSEDNITLTSFRLDIDKDYMNSDFYGIDSSVVTFHSPEIELGKIVNIDSTKLRVVGYVPFDYTAVDIDITTSTAPATIDNYSPNFINNYIGINFSTSTNILGGAHLNTASVWKDSVITKSNIIMPDSERAWAIYPWHKDGSLNNDSKNTGGYGKLKTKKISNLLFSKESKYIDVSNLDIFDTQIFNGTQIRLKTVNPLSDRDYYNYSGNIDSILRPSEVPIKISIEDVQLELDTGGKYPFIVSKAVNEKSPNFNADWNEPLSLLSVVYKEYNTINTSDENISMKYKSTPHAVISLGNVKGQLDLLPSLINSLAGSSYREEDVTDILGRNYNIVQKRLPADNPSNSYLLLAELYREVPNKFGGTDYKNNIWYPAGDSVRLDSSEDIYVEFTQGDTFFARFDSLKTYSDDLDAVNSVTEIGSFMVETRINLDARYDRNRGQQSNLVMNPGNFNLFNDVYNQRDNFFNYRIIDKDIADNTKFPNTIVWSKQKFAGADVDAWTNINMTSSLDLDGTKGELTKLVSFKNEIFSFQPEAINHILFNSRVQIPTSDGVPIELTNAYKVDGARQLSSIGSSNPLAIKSTDRGIYYMDNITKGIYVFNGQQSESLSDKLGMSSWVKNQNIDLYRIDYDKINQDVYFIGTDNFRYKQCLGYSEKLGEFESFFDYNNSEIFNVKDGTYAIKSNKLYKLFEGDYNRFFDDNESSPFWITFTHNENPFNDKIYNTLEFRADTYDYITKDENDKDITPYIGKLSNNSSLNTIKVDNEYQDTEEVSLKFSRYTPSNLKRKFRIWRANIPRDFTNKRDRIRNTWANITLKASNPSNTKTELHDLVVSYFM